MTFKERRPITNANSMVDPIMRNMQAMVRDVKQGEQVCHDVMEDIRRRMEIDPATGGYRYVTHLQLTADHRYSDMYKMSQLFSGFNQWIDAGDRAAFNYLTRDLGPRLMHCSAPSEKLKLMREELKDATERARNYGIGQIEQAGKPMGRLFNTHSSNGGGQLTAVQNWIYQLQHYTGQAGHRAGANPRPQRVQGVDKALDNLVARSRFIDEAAVRNSIIQLEASLVIAQVLASPTIGLDSIGTVQNNVLQTPDSVARGISTITMVTVSKQGLEPVATQLTMMNAVLTDTVSEEVVAIMRPIADSVKKSIRDTKFMLENGMGARRNASTGALIAPGRDFTGQAQIDSLLMQQVNKKALKFFGEAEVYYYSSDLQAQNELAGMMKEVNQEIRSLAAVTKVKGWSPLSGRLPVSVDPLPLPTLGSTAGAHIYQKVSNAYDVGQANLAAHVIGAAQADAYNVLSMLSTTAHTAISNLFMAAPRLREDMLNEMLDHQHRIKSALATLVRGQPSATMPSSPTELEVPEQARANP